MNIRTLLSAVAVLAVVAVPTLGVAQRRLHVDPDHFKVDKNKAKVRPRSLAFNNKDGRHQPRLQGRKDRHKTRKGVRSVTHKLTAPHHPKGK